MHLHFWVCSLLFVMHTIMPDSDIAVVVTESMIKGAASEVKRIFKTKDTGLVPHCDLEWVLITTEPIGSGQFRYTVSYIFPIL